MNLLAKGLKVKSGFVTQYEIPKRAIQEAVTNAVIHRDYHIKKDVEIRVYEDRVEVVSPGMFVYNITVHNIGVERADDYRNALLVKHLRLFPNPPNLDANEGVRAMISEMKENNLYPPTYSTWPTPDDLGLKYYVKVKLINESTPDEWSKVEDYLKKHGSINNKTARSVTGVVQGPTMSRLFKKWVDQGLIERISGPSRSRRDYEYKLNARKELDPKLFSQ